MSASPALAAPAPNRLTVWLLATRPKTLTAALVPVLVGTAAAFHDGVMQPLPALAALLGALFIQVGTNLTNDYFDFKRGADTAQRLGPPRVTQQGWVSPGTVLAAALGSFGLAVLVGLYLVAVGGWPIVAIGVASVLSGYAYTGGPYPLAYHGLGDVFVFVFFGPVAVVGTYYVQSGTVGILPAVASVAVGLVGTSLLIVNNLRDIRTDAPVGKRTLAVRLGERGTRAQYLATLAVAFVVPVVLAVMGVPQALVALVAVPLAIPPSRLVLTQQGAPLNAALAGTARLHLVFGTLLALGLAAGRLG